MYRRIHVRDSVKVVVLLSLSFLFVALENAVKGIVPFSGLLAVMSCGIAINRRRPELAARLSGKYNRLWVAAEVLLFVLVGATVDIGYAAAAGAAAVLVVLGRWYSAWWAYLFACCARLFPPKSVCSV